MTAYPRDGEPYTDEHGETWRGVPWLVSAFQIIAILVCGVVTAMLVVGGWGRW